MPSSTTSSPRSFLGCSLSPCGKVIDIPAAADDLDTTCPAAVPSMPCYITGAPLNSSSLKRIVLVFTDVFGCEAGNHKLFADTLASRLGGGPNDSAAVLIPDLFRGNPIAQPISFLPDVLGILVTLPAFLYRLKFSHRPDYVERDLTQLILPWIQGQVVGSNLTDIGVACVGFCFGGWVAARSLALDELPIKCGVGVHPSFNVECVHFGYEDDVVKRTGTKPILLLPAGNDPRRIKVGGRHTKALAEARNVSEGTISVEFPYMKHGWVSRGDGTDQAISNCQEEAMDMVVKFMERHLA